MMLSKVEDAALPGPFRLTRWECDEPQAIFAVGLFLFLFLLGFGLVVYWNFNYVN